MTDFRNGNDVCFMQQQQQQEQSQQQQQQQKSNAVLRESFHTKYKSNSTPERFQLSAKEQSHSQKQQQNPLLQSLIDYTHSISSQAGCVTAIGQHYNGNAVGIPPMDGIQFDEHEIYYVSPTKRKSSFRSTILANVPIQHEQQHQQQQLKYQQQRFRISSPIRNTINCNEMTGTTIIPTTLTSTVGTILTTTTTTAMTTTTDSGSRLAGVVHDFSLDDTSSHYSDTAMQVLRSGSVSGSIGDTNSRFNNFRLTTTTINNNHNNKNSHSHSSSSSSLATTARFQNHNNNHNNNNNAMVKFSQTLTEQHPQYNGSLQRNKGRSTQSLCSCDAGIDTEINLDSTRPLYQYDVEGKKTHTYTCEQNAQILMRLERERKRKLSLGADVDIGIGKTMQKTMTTAGRAKNDAQKSQYLDMDFNNIPPVPPPPTLKRHGSKLGLQFLQHQHQHQHQLQHQKQKTIDASRNYNGRHSTLEFLCNNDVGSLLDDCTASILKCTNTISDEMGFSTSPAITGKAVLTNTTKDNQTGIQPDNLTDFNKYLHISGRSSHDDIIMPKSQKSDLSLCFLHAKTNALGLSSSGGIEKIGKAVNVAPDLHIDMDGRRNFNKYNTIGPSSVYAKHWPLYCKQLQEAEKQVVEEEEDAAAVEGEEQNAIGRNHCRCFSQSLSSFPMHSYFDNTHTEFSGLDSVDNQHEFHSNIENKPPSYPPIIGNRFSNNMLNNDGQRALTKTNRFHVPTNVFNTSCNYKVAPKPTINLLNEASFLTLNSSTNSGLNHQQQHHNYQQQQHHQTNVYHQNSPHPHRKQNHLHEHTQLHRQYSHHDYLLHNNNNNNNKANVLGLHKQSTIRNQHNHHHHQQQKQQQQTQQQQQHELLQQPLQEKHLTLQTNVTNLMPWKHRQCPSRCSSSSGTNSLRFDAAKHWLAVSSILLIIGAASVAVPLALRVAASAPFEERLRVAQQLLDQVPLIDGHNDLPWNIRKFLHNKLNDFNFDEDLRSVMPWARSHWSHTDLQRLKKGRVSAQFWAAYVPCEAQHRDAVQLTLEQIDVIKRLTDRYAPQLIACTSSEDIIEAHKKHQMCSLTGVEGGHSLGGSLAVLRTLYAIGVRYMTLTSTCHTPWADSSYADAPTFNVKHGGLTIFGKTIIREMNRLGMMVDLSHVSTGTMRDAMEVSEAPVIFSHSSAYELCNSSRNVKDDTLQSLARNGGIVMVNFYSRFLSCNENSTVHDAVAHINHIRKVAGVDHVGLGAGFDGINFTPKGLEDVSTYPTLFAELVGAGWTVEDLTKLAGGNFLRVMQSVEKIRDDKRTLGIKPYEDHPNFRTDDPYNCTSS